MSFITQFGGSIRRDDLDKFKHSPQWNGKIFENPELTKVDVGITTLPGLIKKNLTNRKVRSPEKPLPIIPFSAEAYLSNPDDISFIWYGHSAVLFNIHGTKIFVDPMMGPDCAPIAPMDSPRYSENTLDILDELPEIDIVCYTHDHYDHIDLDSVNRLKGKVKQWLVGLGVSRHLEKWGIPKENIQEFDWWDSIEIGEQKITFTQSRHFSGRGLIDRMKSLWGGWIIESRDKKVYWSGDGGYGKHFKTVQEKFQRFDLAFIECGQYNKLWHKIHLHPEESVQAAIDVQAEISVPVHWGGFALALHPWKEPIERFTKEAKRVNLKYCTPLLGEYIELGKLVQGDAWWESYA